MDQSTHDSVAPVLGEFGLPVPTNFLQTMLMHDGYFVGWKVRCGRGYAISHTGPMRSDSSMNGGNC
jgi:hypothetical protein